MPLVVTGVVRRLVLRLTRLLLVTGVIRAVVVGFRANMPGIRAVLTGISVARSRLFGSGAVIARTIGGVLFA